MDLETTPTPSKVDRMIGNIENLEQESLPKEKLVMEHPVMCLA